MQDSVNVEINMFGMLKKFSEEPPLMLGVPAGSSIAEILDVLKKNLANRFPDFNHHKVIDASVLADEKEVLKHDHIINQDTSLAVLPPVCGG